jgi:hypothetical protein
MNGDHASTEKGTYKGMGGLKHQVGVKGLGEDALRAKTIAELVIYLQQWNMKKITDAGGIAAWDALSLLEQAERDKQLMDEVVEALGKEEYDALPADERRRLDLFIWAGCCMHKDQNSFKGGNTEMMSEWERLGIPGPALLCNKANSVALRRILEPGTMVPDPLTELEQKAFEESTRGSVKLCAIAGAMLNNKDSKKRPRGQAHRIHDLPRWEVP